VVLLAQGERRLAIAYRLAHVILPRLVVSVKRKYSQIACWMTEGGNRWRR
jgi:hypothetical protein